MQKKANRAETSELVVRVFAGRMVDGREQAEALRGGWEGNVLGAAGLMGWREGVGHTLACLSSISSCAACHALVANTSVVSKLTTASFPRGPGTIATPALICWSSVARTLLLAVYCSSAGTTAPSLVNTSSLPSVSFISASRLSSRSAATEAIFSVPATQWHESYGVSARDPRSVTQQPRHVIRCEIRCQRSTVL